MDYLVQETRWFELARRGFPVGLESRVRGEALKRTVTARQGQACNRCQGVRQRERLQAVMEAVTQAMELEKEESIHNPAFLRVRSQSAG